MKYYKIKKLFDEFVEKYYPSCIPFDNDDIHNAVKLYGKNFKDYLKFRNLFTAKNRAEIEKTQWVEDHAYIDNWRDVGTDEDPYNKHKKKDNFNKMKNQSNKIDDELYKTDDEFDKMEDLINKKFQICDTEKKKKDKNVPEKKIYKCMLNNCNRQYTSLFGLKYHIKEGHSEAKMRVYKPFVCYVEGCGRKYKNKNGLMYHLRTIHNIE